MILDLKTKLHFSQTSTFLPQDHYHIHDVVNIFYLVVWGKLIYQFPFACTFYIWSVEIQVIQVFKCYPFLNVGIKEPEVICDPSRVIFHNNASPTEKEIQTGLHFCPFTIKGQILTNDQRLSTWGSVKLRVTNG